MPYIAAAGARVFVYISRHLFGCLRLSGVQNTLIFTSRVTLCWWVVRFHLGSVHYSWDNRLDRMLCKNWTENWVWRPYKQLGTTMSSGHMGLEINAKSGDELKRRGWSTLLVGLILPLERVNQKVYIMQAKRTNIWNNARNFCVALTRDSPKFPGVYAKI